MAEQIPRPCFDVLEDFDEIITGIIPPDQRYYVLGGTVTSAIINPKSFFHHPASQLIACGQRGEPTIRDNGTRRDLDVLILNELPKASAQAISQKVAKEIDGELEVSVFGLDKHKPITRIERVAKSFGGWTSRRTIDDSGVIRLRLFPFEEVIPDTAFKPWKLMMDSGKSFSIFNPVAHLLAYMSRSVTSVRYKDIEKVEAMEERLLPDDYFVEQVRDGELNPLWQFSKGIFALNDPGVDCKSLAAEYNMPEIYFRIARVRSYLLQILESNDKIVAFAQKSIGQSLTKPFTGST